MMKDEMEVLEKPYTIIKLSHDACMGGVHTLQTSCPPILNWGDNSWIMKRQLLFSPYYYSLCIDTDSNQGH